jgi:hypothetical protein
MAFKPVSAVTSEATKHKGTDGKTGEQLDRLDDLFLNQMADFKLL